MPLSGPQPPRVTYRDEALPEEELEARKVGVRTLSKERWEALQIENVEYPDILIRRIAMSSAPSDNAPVAPDGKSMAMASQNPTSTDQPPREPQPQPQCLIRAAQFLPSSLPCNSYG